MDAIKNGHSVRQRVYTSTSYSPAVEVKQNANPARHDDAIVPNVPASGIDKSTPMIKGLSTGKKLCNVVVWVWEWSLRKPVQPSSQGCATRYGAVMSTLIVTLFLASVVVQLVSIVQKNIHKNHNRCCKLQIHNYSTKIDYTISYESKAISDDQDSYSSSSAVTFLTFFLISSTACFPKASLRGGFESSEIL